MKKLISLILLPIAAIPAIAATARLAWDPNPASEQITQYIVQYKQATDSTYTLQQVFTNTTGDVTLPAVAPGVNPSWVFRALAVNIRGTSAPSAEVVLPPIPGSVRNLRITFSFDVP